MTRARIGHVTTFVTAAIVVAACSNSHRKSGLTVPSAVGAGNGSLSGTLASNATGAPISGATVRLGTVVALSNSSGAFTLAGTPESGSAVVTAVLPGFLFRGVAFSLAPVRTGVTLDVIQDAAPFSLAFYRALARNGVESATLRATSRWTMSPSFHFQALTTDTALRVPDTIIQSIQANFVKSVAELSGGRFSAAAFETTDGAVDPKEGWVNVVFYQSANGGVLGFSSVGGNMGTMNLRYEPTLVSNANTNPYTCASIPLAVADHEIIHTMGFWHTEDTLADEFSGPGCPGVGRASTTLYHANIVYSRPIGNIDPDVDPVSSFHALASAVDRPVVRCDFANFLRGR